MGNCTSNVYRDRLLSLNYLALNGYLIRFATLSARLLACACTTNQHILLRRMYSCSTVPAESPR